MKSCTKCNRQVPAAAEICECGHWFRAASPVSTTPHVKQSSGFGGVLLKVFGAIVVLVVVLIAKGIGKEVGHSVAETADAFPPSSLPIDEVLRITSNRVNSQLPTMVDKDTRLDSTVAGPGAKWTYLYTIVSMHSSQLTEQELQQSLGPTLTKSVCTSKQMRPFTDNGVQIVYRYRGNDGSMIGDIVVPAGSCG